MKTFEYSVLIRESDLDTFGHVNNARYLTLFEDARWELIHNGGFGLKVVKEKEQGPVVLEIQIRYKKEIRLRERIKIVSTVLPSESEAKRNITMRMVQKMVNEKQEECCTAEFVFGFFDLKTRKLIPPTNEWLKAIGVLD